ncbi:cell division cycle protein 123 homolog [Aplysia californica]|uniref:Cell division cycle protein 123 homolog n=1 Tax=Aplysia californica TaxID=6500 RepID=A0ABM0JWH5_APLCA|nr:cell division cycle protein 123 homolog [Aplysia californica]
MTEKTLAEQLQSVKLKSTGELTRDYSSPKTGGFLHQDEINAYQESVLDANMEEWLQYLKDFTFPSEFVPITIDEANMFVNVYRRLFANLDPSGISTISWKENLSAEELVKVEDISCRLQTAIDSFTRKEEAKFVFIKLSSRSPKDAPLAQDRFKSLYKHYLEKEQKEERFLENTQIKCLLKACFEALRMSTADEALDACFRSERTYQDLLLALAVPDRFRENWVIRKFVEIDVDMEFRAFVSNRRMTAISQYNFLYYSKRLKENQQYYCDLIHRFYEQEIAEKLQGFLHSFIIDFAVCGEGSKIWVIEINPFLPTTDSALFSWEREKQLLEGSHQDLVFRVTEKPRPGAKSMLPAGMKDLINACKSEN